MLRIFDDTKADYHAAGGYEDVVIKESDTTPVNTIWTAKEAAVLLGLSDEDWDNFGEKCRELPGDLFPISPSQCLREYIKRKGTK